MRKSGRYLLNTFAVVLTLIVCNFAFAGCISDKQAYDPKKINGEFGQKAMDNLRFLEENYSDRTMGTQAEYDAALYFAETLKSYGYASEYSHEEVEGLQSFKINLTRYDGSAVNDATAYNVSFTKKSENSKGEIILSAQYDNLYAEMSDGAIWKADGSYESGSACAVLLTLAELMKDRQYDYDITFVFFTGGSYRWIGAYHYASQLKNADYDDLKLMVNFSMLGGGDNLYLYTGEKETDYGRYLGAATDGLSAIPKNKNVASYTMDTEAAYPYTHIGMSGNQYYFMNRGVPTANYLSHNWSLNDYPLLTEMDGKQNVYHSSGDTLANLIERKGEEKLKSQFNNIVCSVLSALDGENSLDLDNVLMSAKSQVVAKGQGMRLSSILEIAIKISAVGVIFAIMMAVRRYIINHRAEFVAPSPETREDSIKPFDFESYPSEKEDGGDEEKPFDDPFS